MKSNCSKGLLVLRCTALKTAFYNHQNPDFFSGNTREIQKIVLGKVLLEKTKRKQPNIDLTS